MSVDNLKPAYMSLNFALMAVTPEVTHQMFLKYLKKTVSIAKEPPVQGDASDSLIFSACSDGFWRGVMWAHNYLYTLYSYSTQYLYIF